MRKTSARHVTVFVAAYYVLASAISFSQTAPVVGEDYADGEVILTFKPEHMPSAENVTASPPGVGITALDGVFAAVQAQAIVKLIPTYGALVSQLGQRMERKFLLVYASGEDPMNVATDLLTQPYFEDVTVNSLWRFDLAGTNRIVPSGSTTRFPDQWYFDNADNGDRSDIDLPEAWALEQGDTTLVIGIFDSGIMVDRCAGGTGWRLHSDFNYFFLPGEDKPPIRVLDQADFLGVEDNGDQFIDNVVGTNLAKGCESCQDQGPAPLWAALPQDWTFGQDPPEHGCLPDPGTWDITGFNNHGTRVGSIAAAKMDGLKKKHPSDTVADHKDIVGVAPNCKVYNVRFGCPVGDAQAAMALRLLATHCRVVNMSFGRLSKPAFNGGSNDFENMVVTVTEQVSPYDCVLVGAVGNGGNTSGVIYPARFDSVFAVGGMSRSGPDGPALVDYSNYSISQKQVDAVAPIESLTTTKNGILADRHPLCGPGQPCGSQTFGPTCSPNETVGLSSSGTSFAAPQVAGIAALIRSRFPGLNQSQVKHRIRKSAEYYWSASDGTRPSNKYGFGKVNAYRALTEWGKINTNTTWSTTDTRDGKYYVSGDLTIESGWTLTINPGVVVKVAPDHEQGAPDLARVKITVKSGGTLRILGTPTSKVTFESFTDSPPTALDWTGIQFEPGSTGTVNNVVIRNAQLPIRSFVPLTIDGCVLERGVDAIQTYNNVVVKNTTIRDFTANGIVWVTGNLEVRNVEVSNCPYGVSQSSTNPTGTFLCRSARFQNTTVSGISVTGSNAGITIKKTTVEDATDGIRLALQSSSIIDSCTIRDNDIGISVQWSTGTSIRRSAIAGNTTAGVYLAGYAHAIMELDTISGSPVGVHCNYSSSPTITSTRILTNTLGLKCEATSNPLVRTTRINSGAIGVLALSGSLPDLGVSAGETCGSGGQEGLNSIHNHTLHNVANFDPETIVYAQCDWWGGTPAPQKFYGNVVYTPYRSNDPNPAGMIEEPGPGDLPPPRVPMNYALHANRPNPFNPVTTIGYDVPTPGGHVELVIYDVSGRRVRALVANHREPGTHTTTWEGQDDGGTPVASGVYFVRMNAGAFTQTRKVVLLK